MVSVQDGESVIYISLPDLRFANCTCCRLFLKFFLVDVSYDRGNRASHSFSVLLFINRSVVLKYVDVNTKFKKSAVKFVRLARSLSFSSFRNAA